jgi:hypothetical protein
MSNESKHTPGPWETGALMTRVEVLLNGWNAPMCIADCHAKNAPESDAERVANAKLISAAPDMLKALIKAERWITDLLNELRDDHPTLFVYNEVFAGSIRNKIINAIDKAGGKHD